MDNTDYKSYNPWVSGGVFNLSSASTSASGDRELLAIVREYNLSSSVITFLGVAPTYESPCDCSAFINFSLCCLTSHELDIGNQKDRYSTIGCGKTDLTPANIASSQDPGDRLVFNSPETSFGQPFLGNILRLESTIFGGGQAHFVEVKNNANYKLLSREAQEDALSAADSLASVVSFDPTALFTAYQAYLTIFVNGITRRNYAWSFNSTASYPYSKSIPNDTGFKQRNLDIAQYLIPGVQNVGDTYNINNFQRESSVYLRTPVKAYDLTRTALKFPDYFLNDSTGTPILQDKSRYTAGGSNICNSPGLLKDISVVSYYGSIKNEFINQWGQMYSYNTIDTGFQVDLTLSKLGLSTVFGGDTFISRFAFKTKLPFFIDNRVNAPDDSDIFYDEIGNIAYPKYWHSARSILVGKSLGPNNYYAPAIISYKAHEFDCPNSQETGGTLIASSNRTFYDGMFYLFAYGIPSFYCESSYNVDLRQAFNNKEGDFWPHVSTGIPDDWLQQTFVPIAQDNTYYYNVTFSKQNKENYFSHLPVDWTELLCNTYFPFRAIYSDTQTSYSNDAVNNWLIYRPISSFDFPQNYGNLISLDGIQNRAVLARFENKSLLYNTLLTVQTSNPQAAYLGNDTLFKSAPPIDFAETDLGYVGSQNKMLLKIPQGQITVDAKRGQIFLIAGNQATDLSAFGSGLNRFFTDHLAFEILRYFPDKYEVINGQKIYTKGVDTDNHFNGIGLHGVYDSKYDRVIISKLDYIPLSDDVKYDNVTREFYIEKVIGTLTEKTVVYLTDPEYFCNKSWTLSFNFNTKTWISFHSYIPNWYIAENNFFYSGLNGCCDLEAIAVEEFNCPTCRPTTTTTTTICLFCKSDPVITTTTTTATPLDCTLAGNALETLCELAGTAVMVGTTTTTTTCIIPADVDYFVLYNSYSLTGQPSVNIGGSYEDACNGLLFLFQLAESSYSLGGVFAYGNSLNVGDSLYSTNCQIVPDGFYFLSVGYSNIDANILIYQIVNGVIIAILPCSCANVPTTTTTTTIINLTDCCSAIFSNDDKIFTYNTNLQTTVDLDVPGLVTPCLGIAITDDKLFSVSTQFDIWDITLGSFSATFNSTVAFPAGFTTNVGVVALNNTTLIAINTTPIIKEVVEIDLTGPSFTTKFALIADRLPIGNPLYTTEDKLLLLNSDSITGYYYITQYDYATGGVDLDIYLTMSCPVAIGQCGCDTFIINCDGIGYAINMNYPHDVAPTVLNITGDYITGLAQKASCISTGFTLPTELRHLRINNPAPLYIDYNQDFTIEFWMKPSSTSPTIQALWSDRDRILSNLSMHFFPTTKIEFITFLPHNFISTYPLDTWLHIALVRDSSVSLDLITLYLNGNAVSSFFSGNPLSFFNHPLVIGADPPIEGTFPYYVPYTKGFKGFMCDFRWTGSAVYTNNFTPPTDPLTALPETKLLLFQGTDIVQQTTDNSGLNIETDNYFLIYSPDSPYPGYEGSTRFNL